MSRFLFFDAAQKTCRYESVTQEVVSQSLLEKMSINRILLSWPHTILQKLEKFRIVWANPHLAFLVPNDNVVSGGIKLLTADNCKCLLLGDEVRGTMVEYVLGVTGNERG